MFFEDEKDNLENSDSLEDLELDLDDEIDDESISWDELLKDSSDELVSVSSDNLSAVKEEPAAKKKAASKTAPKTKKSQKAKQAAIAADDVDLDLSELTDGQVDEPDDIIASKRDAFEVFGGESENESDISADNIMDDDEQSILNQLDEMDVTPELEDEISYQPPKQKAGLINNIPVLAGILFAAVLVLGSLIFIFMGPKNAGSPELPVSEVQQEAQVDESADVKLPPDSAATESIPVVNDKNAKDLKADKKVVLSVESAGRMNPFLPTTAEFDKNLYSGIPAQALMPPESYGNEPDAQELMKVSVSGILFDSVKPSAIITINGSDYFVQKNDLVDDYRVLDINRQSVVIKKGTNIYKAGVGERFSQNVKIDGSAIYQTGAYTGARKYSSVSESNYTSPSEVQVNVRPE